MWIETFTLERRKKLFLGKQDQKKRGRDGGEKGKLEHHFPNDPLCVVSGSLEIKPGRRMEHENGEFGEQSIAKVQEIDKRRKQA